MNVAKLVLSRIASRRAIFLRPYRSSAAILLAGARNAARVDNT
jgi:hypothetical protein